MILSGAFGSAKSLYDDAIKAGIVITQERS